jgi:putative phosphoesterase
MQVALIGHVHANLPALEAVLDHAREQGASAIWNVGDSIGYGAFPNEVVHRLRKENALSTLGDYDHRVLRFKKRKDQWHKKKQLEEYLALQWAYEQLSKKNRKYLRFLSREIRMKVKGRRILLTHASPGPANGSKQGDAPRDDLLRLAREAGADIVVHGRSPKARVRHVGDAVFVNPGSVGLPAGSDPGASYAILQIDPETVQVHPYRVAYDVERHVSAIRDHGLPEAFAQMFLQRRDLKTILQSQED